MANVGQGFPFEAPGELCGKDSYHSVYVFHNAAPCRRFRETPPTATLKTKQYYCGVTPAAPAVSKTVCWTQSELQEGKKSLFSLSQVTKPLTLVSGLTPYQWGAVCHLLFFSVLSPPGGCWRLSASEMSSWEGITVHVAELQDR